jgi:DNA-binding response OmpR family regulator
MLVDDDPVMVRLIHQILVAHGFGPPTAVPTGQEALAKAGETDVILLDHQLPDLSGMEVLAELRSRPHPPAVILITAYGNESLVAKALRDGADDYLAKDAALAELLPQVLERVRRNRALRDALAAAERELLRAERLAAIGEMTVTLHHQINNPLMAASAEAELLLAGSERLSEHAHASVLAIKHGLDRIRDIVRRIGDLKQAQSTEYLSGLRMIDLEAGANGPAPSRGAAVLLIPDESLARVSALLLRSAGFDVRRCMTTAEAERAASGFGVSAVLVAGGARSGGADPLGGFRPEPGHAYRLIALTRGDEAAARAAGADHVVTLPFDPGTFAAEVVEAVGPVAT